MLFGAVLGIWSHHFAYFGAQGMATGSFRLWRAQEIWGSGCLFFPLRTIVNQKMSNPKTLTP